MLIFYAFQLGVLPRFDPWHVSLTLSRVGGGAIILLNFPTLKWGVLTHKHDPKRVCKFKLDHFVAPGAIFEDFFFRGVPPGTPRI